MTKLRKEVYEEGVWLEHGFFLPVLPAPQRTWANFWPYSLCKADPGVSLPVCSFQTPGMWLLVPNDGATHLVQTVSPLAPHIRHTQHLAANDVPDSWGWVNIGTTHPPRARMVCHWS